jgi:hypothetical protein
MERVALGGGDDGLRLGEDIGNVIELGDLNDDLGLGLLSNPSKVSVSKGSDSGRSVSINAFAGPQASSSDFGGGGGGGGGGISFDLGSGGSGSGGLSGIEITPLEPLEPISIDPSFSTGPPVEVSIQKDFVPPSNSNTGAFGSLFSNAQSATGPGVVLSSGSGQMDPMLEKKEKSDYLNKLQRLEQKGFPVSRKFTMDNSLEEIKTEYFRLVDARQLETSIKFQRQMLMGAITGLEWLNGRFDPFDLKLDGWSEQVNENVEDFDEIFEELYDKYKDRGKMSPEVRLILAIGGSGFMCHVSNSFFRSKMPSMDDVLRNNPQLMRQMASAAAQQAGPGFGNFMGMAMGLGANPGNGGPMGQAGPVPDTGAFYGASAAAPVSPPPPPPMPPMMAPRGPINMSQMGPGGSQGATARREMAGPSGVDDILRQFEAARAAEAAGSMPQPAAGFSTGPAVAAAAAASVVSADELMSQAESARTGATGRGRRRKAQPPVGNTVSLNV